MTGWLITGIVVGGWLILWVIKASLDWGFRKSADGTRAKSQAKERARITTKLAADLDLDRPVMKANMETRKKYKT